MINTLKINTVDFFILPSLMYKCFPVAIRGFDTIFARFMAFAVYYKLYSLCRVLINE